MATKITRVFQKDKVVGLTHSAGNISIQSGSILTIGGLQYILDSQKSVALPALSANSRYQVYAVISGGDVILVISQNENSVGPSGYTSWKLVGSFYADGLSSVSFGSFVDIATKPTTGRIPFLFVLANLGTGSATALEGYWWRDGQHAKATYRFQKDGSGGSGAGQLQVSWPTSIPKDLNQIPGPGDATYFPCGEMVMNSAVGLNQGNNHGQHTVSWNATNNFAFLAIENAQFINGGNVAANAVVAARIELNPIVGWGNTPIQDL